MKIYGIDNSELFDVKIASSARHEEEMMKSDFVRLSWKGNVKQTLPVGTYIIPFADGLKYRLIEPYTPQQDAEDTFTYQPEFQHPLMWLGKVPFTYATKSTLGEDVVQQEWEYTGLTSTLLQYAADFINTAFGFTAKADKFSPSMTGDVDTNVSVSFSSTDVLSALTSIANACSANKCEWHLSWKYRKLYFGQVSVNYAETAPTLKVGVNVGKASVSGGGEGYYNVFFPQGSTRNMSAKAASGENVSTGIRLGLDKTKYPDGMIDTRANANEPKQTLALTFDDVYPHVDCYAYNVRHRTRYLLDDNNEKVVSSYNSDGSVKEYKKYTVWYMRLAYPVTSEISGKTKVATTTETVDGKTQTLYWYDYVVEDSQILDGYTLCGSFSANTNEGALASSLVAQPGGSDGFELRFHKAAETIPADAATGDSGVSVLAGDFEIVFVNQNDTIIPTNESEGLIPRGESEPSTKCNIVVLYNIAMGDEEVAAAQDELEQRTRAEIAYRQSDLNNYTFNAYPQVWAKNNPKLYIGQRVVYDDGNGYSYTTRVMKLVTNIDYDIVQEITVGNAAVKGTVSQLKEDVQAIMSGNWSGGGGLNTNEVLAIVRNYVTPRFLSRQNADTAQGLITFKSGLAVGGSWGIGKDGDATLLSAASQNWKITAEGLAELARVVADEMMNSAFGGDDLVGGKGYHYWVDEYGRSHVVTDYFTARVKAFFAELEVRKVSASTGNIVFSNASSRLVYVEDYDDGNGMKGYKCWFSEDDGTTATTNSWEVGDQAQCRTFNIKEGVYTNVSNRYYWRLVVGKGEGTPKDADGNNVIDDKTYGYVILGDTYTASDGTETTLVSTLADGDATVKPYGGNASFRLKQTKNLPEEWTACDAPQAGDTVAQLGCQTADGVATRGNAMQIVTNGESGTAVPSLDMYSAISGYDLSAYRVIQLSPQGIVATVRMSQITIVNDAGKPVSLFNWRGAWADGSTVNNGDVFAYGGQTWAWDGDDNSTPSAPGTVSTEAWELVAERGDAGADGKDALRNLLTGSGLKNASTASGSMPELVVNSDSGGENTVEVDSSTLYLGTNSLHIKTGNTGKYPGMFFSPVAVKRDTAYTVSVMAKGTGSVTIEVVNKTAATTRGIDRDGWLYGDVAGTVAAADGWKLISVPFTTDGSHDWVEVDFHGNPKGEEFWLSRPMLEEGDYKGWTLNEADLKGDRGDDGTSVTKTGEKVEYQRSASGTKKPTGDWETAPPDYNVYTPWLWTRITVTFSSGDPVESYSVARQGADGKGISGTPVTYYYNAGASGSPRPDDGLFTSEDFPDAGKGDYVWSMTVTTYTDGTATKAYACNRIGDDGSRGAGVHIAYATSAGGADGFSTTWFDGAAYIGVCVSDDVDDPSDPTKYEWSRMKGEDGVGVGRNLLRNATFKELGTVRDDAGNVVFRMGDHPDYCHRQASLYGGTDGAYVSVPATETEGHYSGFFFAAPVEAGKTYTASVMAYGAGGLSGGCLLEVHANDGTGGSGRDSSYTFEGGSATYSVGGSWTLYKRTFTVPANGLPFVEVNFWVGGEAGSGMGFGTLYVCQPKLEEGGAATAFCLNEADLKGDGGSNGAQLMVKYAWSQHATADGCPADIDNFNYVSEDTPYANWSWGGWADTAGDQPDGKPYLWMLLVYVNGKGTMAGNAQYMRANPKDGVPVTAQYSSDGGSWHSPFADGDVWMRLSDDGGSTWGEAIRVVGEKGDGGAWTDYGFNISSALTTAGTTTAPSDLGYAEWQDAPAATTGERPYLWMRVQKRKGDGAADGDPSYVRLTGKQGDKGDDAVTYEIDPVEEAAQVEITESGDMTEGVTVSGTLAVSCQYKVYRKTGGVRESGTLSGVTITKAVFNNDTATTSGVSTGLTIDDTNLKVTGTGIDYNSNDSRTSITITFQYGGSTIGVRTVPVTFAPASMIEADDKRWTQIYANGKDISAIQQQGDRISLKVDRINTPARNLLAMSGVGERIVTGKYLVTDTYTLAAVKGRTYTITWKGRVENAAAYMTLCVYNSSWSFSAHASWNDTADGAHRLKFTATADETLTWNGRYTAGGTVADPESYPYKIHTDWLRIDEGDWTSEDDGLGLLEEWKPADADLEAVNLLPDHLLETDTATAVDEANVGTRERVPDDSAAGTSGLTVATGTDTDKVKYIRLTRSNYTGTDLYGGVRWYIPFRGAGDYTLSASFKDMRPTSFTPSDGDGSGVFVHLRPCDSGKKRIAGAWQIYLNGGSGTGYGWEHRENTFSMTDEMAATSSGELTAGTAYKVAWLEIMAFVPRNGDMAVSRLCLSKCSHATLWNAQDVSPERKDEARQLATGIDIYNRKIVATGDTFEWRDNSGNAIAEFDADNGATFRGNVSAETFSTNNGGMAVGEDGVLHATGAEIEGEVSTAASGRRATLSGDGMQIYDASGNLVTEHTSAAYDSVESLTGGTSGSLFATTSCAETSTDHSSMAIGGKLYTKELIARQEASRGGRAKIGYSLAVNSHFGASSSHAGSIYAKGAVYLLDGDTGKRYNLYAGGVSSTAAEGQKGTGTVTGSVTLAVAQGHHYTFCVECEYGMTGSGSVYPGGYYGVATARITGISYDNDSWHATFFGNGLMLNKGTRNYLAAMLADGAMLVEAMSGDYGLRLASGGMYRTSDGSHWLPMVMRTVTTSGGYAVEDDVDTVVCTSSCTVTLPAAPPAGRRVTVIHAYGTSGNMLVKSTDKSMRCGGTTRATSQDQVKSSTAGEWVLCVYNGTLWDCVATNGNPF